MRAILRRPVGNLKEGTWVNISKFYKRLDNTMAVIAGDFNSGVQPLRCSLSDVTLFPERGIKEAAVIPTNVARGVCDAVDVTMYRRRLHIKEGGTDKSFNMLIENEILKPTHLAQTDESRIKAEVDLALKGLDGFCTSVTSKRSTYDLKHTFLAGAFSLVTITSKIKTGGEVHLRASSSNCEIGECTVRVTDQFHKVAKEALKQWAEKANRT